MEISKKLLNFKFHILVGSTLLLFFFFFLCYFAPSFLDIVKYFWPLLISTALFLFSVVVFGWISPPPDAPGEKAGEGLLDYVAGQPEQVDMEPLSDEAEFEESVKDE